MFGTKTDYSVALAEIERLTKDNQTIPRDLHERAVRLGLRQVPDDWASIYSLVAILHLSNHAPLPDDEILAASADWQSKNKDQAGLDELLEKADRHANSGELWETFTTLWQAVLRYPESALPWADYARHLAQSAEWSFAALAAERALSHPRSTEPRAAKSLLAAMAMLAEEQRLGALQWRPWLDRLSDELASSATALVLLLRTQNKNDAIERLPRLVAQDSRDYMVWLTASKVSLEQNLMKDAHTYLVRAFEADFTATLHAVVRHWSGPATMPSIRAGQIDQFAQFLEDRSRLHPGANLIPGIPSVRGAAIARRQREEALERGLPAAFFITQGKSGSVSVANILSSGFGLPTVLYSWIQQLVIPSWLTDYMRGGASYTTHLLATEENINRLAEGGVKRVIVHIRDPRQVAVSMWHHVENYPAYVIWPDESWARKDSQERLDHIVQNHMSASIEWIEGWYGARSKFEVEFTTFEEFVADPDAYCDRLVGLYGGDTRYFDRSAAFAKQPNTDYHIRRGETDEWRTVLTPRQIDIINSKVPAQFWKAFNWTP